MSPRAEAAVLHQDRGVLVGPIVVALHHVRPVDDDLAVLTGSSVTERSIWIDTPGIALTDAAHLAMAGIVRGGDGARLGEAVALVDRDAERVDERRHLRAERGAAADRVLEAPAEALADRGEDEAIGERQQRRRREVPSDSPFALRFAISMPCLKSHWMTPGLSAICAFTPS